MSDTSGFGGDGAVTVDVNLDPAAAANLAKVIDAAIAGGFKKGFAGIGKILSNNRDIANNLKKIQEGMIKAFDPKVFRKFTEGFTQAETKIARFAGSLIAMGHATSTVNKEVEASMVQMRRTMVASNDKANASQRALLADKKQGTVEFQLLESKAIASHKADMASRLQTERAALDSAGRIQRQAAQESVLAASTAGRQRVQITRAVIDQIQRLERGLGSAVSGIAKTGVSAISRTSSALGSGLGNLFRRDAAEVGQSNGLLKRSLHERESVIRMSLNKQERLARESMTRQAATYSKLRSVSSRGVAGAVSGRGLGGGLAAITGGIGLAALLKQGFTDTTNLTEQLGKNKILFGQYTQQIVDFSKTSVRALGVTQAAALESTGTFGNLFKGFGSSADEAAKKSIVFTQLASDMASFSNTSVDQAFTALSAGLVGESEPLKRYGVIVNDAALKTEALAQGLYNGKGALTASARAQAAYSLILKQTSDQQGDFARTSMNGANAQKIFGAAVRTVFSDLASLIKGVSTAALNFLIPVLTKVSELIKGENLSGGMKILRDGLKGVAIALGVLLAAKAGVEVLQLIGAAAKLALTPLGAFVLAVGAIGAAIAILAPRSEAFRNAIAGVVDWAKGAASAVRTFITDTAVPAIIRFSDVVRDKLVTAYRNVVDFVKTQVIPRLREFATFITTVAVPAVIDFGKKVAHWFQMGLGRVKEFWHAVEPILRPAIDGFKALGGAIADIFKKGSFSGILGGLGSAASGVGKTFSSIGQGIFNALKPVGKKVLDFLKETFSGKNLEKLAVGFIDFVEAIGRFIGSHISIITKSIVVIGGAVAAAAVILGVKFAKGFVDGLKKAIGGLISEAFSGDIFSAAILAGLAGAAVFGVFKLFGSKAAKSVIEGVRTTSANGKGFLSALFGGTGGALKMNDIGANSDFNRQIRDTQNQLRILGSTKIVDTRNLTEAKRELHNLRKGFTDAQVSALTLRDKTSGAFRAISIGIQGAGGVLGGLKTMGKAVGQLGVDFNSFGSGNFIKRFVQGLSAGGSQIRIAFQSTLNGLKAVAQEQGMKWGTYVGKGVAIGLASAVGGFVAGKAAGSAGASPLLTGLTTGITAGAATGNPIVGVIAGGAAAIGAAFGNADKAAREFRDSVKTLGAALKTDLAAGLKTAADGSIALADAFQLGGTGAVAEQIKTLLGPDVLDTLQKRGLGLQDVMKSLGSGDLTGILGNLNLADGFNKDFYAAAALAEALKVLTKARKDYNAEVAFDNTNGLSITTPGHVQTPLAKPKTGVYATPDMEGLSNVAQVAKQASAALDGVFKARPNTDVKTAVKEVATAFEGAKLSADEFTAALAAVFGVAPDSATAIANAIVDVNSLIQQYASLDLSTVLGSAQATQILNQFGTDIATTIAAGVHDETIRSVADANLALGPLLQSAFEGIDTAVKAGVISEEAGAALKAEFMTKVADGIAAAGPEITKGINDLGVPITAASISLGFVMKIEATKIGFLYATGAANGIGDPSSIAKITSAAANLGFQALDALKRSLRTGSPSKATYEIGEFVGEGLANGISDSTKDLGDMLAAEVDKIINKAKTAAEKGAQALRGLFGGLFGQSVGSGNTSGTGGISTVAIPTAIGGFTGAFNNFLSTFDSNLATVFATAGAYANQGQEGQPMLTQAQLDILGESLFSLNPADVIGSSNLSALTAALDAVEGLGSSMLAAGVNPAAVADTLKQYVDKIKFQAVALGFSTDEVNSLIASLGLSNSALDAFATSATNAAAAVTNAATAIDTVSASPIPIELADYADLSQQDPDKLKSFIEQYIGLSPEELKKAFAGFTQADLPAGYTLEYILEAIRLANTGVSPEDTKRTDTQDPTNQTNESLPYASTQVFNIYPPTNDVEAIALGIANSSALLARIPGG